MKFKLKKKGTLAATDIGGGDIIDGQGLSGGTVSGTSGGDIAIIANAQNVTLALGAGDDMAFLTDFAGRVVTGTGNDFVDAFTFSGTLDTGAGSDILSVTNGASLNILAGSGDDAVTVNGAAGRINAGAGADIVQIANVTGPLTIDLGRDRDGDILIIDATTEQFAQITLRNYDERFDTLIWNNTDAIA